MFHGAKVYKFNLLMFAGDGRVKSKKPYDVWLFAFRDKPLLWRRKISYAYTIKADKNHLCVVVLYFPALTLWLSLNLWFSVSSLNGKPSVSLPMSPNFLVVLIHCIPS